MQYIHHNLPPRTAPPHPDEMLPRGSTDKSPNSLRQALEEGRSILLYMDALCQANLDLLKERDIAGGIGDRKTQVMNENWNLLKDRLSKLTKVPNFLEIISNKRSYQETTSVEERQENQLPNKRRNIHSEQEAVTLKSSNGASHLLEKLFRERHRTGDVCCHFADGTLEKMHSFVLVESSSYFKETIDNLKRRSLDSEQPIQLFLTDMDPLIFLEIVEFLYKINLLQNTASLTMSRICCFLNYADRYSIPRLYKECVRFIHANVSLASASRFLEIAIECNSIIAQNLILDLICLNAHEFLFSGHLRKIKLLNKECLIKILQDDRLNLDEQDVSTIALHWLEDKVKDYSEINKTKKEREKESLLELIQSVSSHIRLSLISHDVLFDYWMKVRVGNHPLFSEAKI